MDSSVSCVYSSYVHAYYMDSSVFHVRTLHMYTRTTWIQVFACVLFICTLHAPVRTRSFLVARNAYPKGKVRTVWFSRGKKCVLPGVRMRAFKGGCVQIF